MEILKTNVVIYIRYHYLKNQIQVETKFLIAIILSCIALSYTRYILHCFCEVCWEILYYMATMIRARSFKMAFDEHMHAWTLSG